MISLLRSMRRARCLNRVLWSGICLISGVVFYSALRETPKDVFTNVRLIGSAVTVIIATFGLLLRWGLLIPMTLIGAVLNVYFNDPNAFYSDSAFFSDLSVPAIGATIGALLGLLLDS